MRSALKHLFLLGDRCQHDLQCRPLEVITESAWRDAQCSIFHAMANCAKRLQTRLRTDKPSVVNRFKVGFVQLDMGL